MEPVMPLRNNNSTTYWRNEMPLCPHCDHVCDINRLEWYGLYDTQEGEHEVECPECEKGFVVSVTCAFSFSTCDQPEPEPDSAGEKP